MSAHWCKILFGDSAMKLKTLIAITTKPKKVLGFNDKTNVPDSI